MEHRKFIVGDKPWCLWSHDVNKLNRDFLDSLDPNYYDYLADFYADHFIEGEGEDEEVKQQNQYLALTLRTAYSQALETFFALLFASIQAPYSVIGWMHKYQNHQLMTLVDSVDKFTNIYTLMNENHFTWEKITNIILSFNLEDSEKEQLIKNGFARIWRNLANEYKQKSFIDEYNSAKHGTRLHPGGSWLAVGLEDQPGVRPKPEKMRLIGKDEFGSSFYSVDKLEVPEPNPQIHFRMLRHNRNWELTRLFLGLKLLAMSIHNVLSFLKIVNEINTPEELEFIWPNPIDTFDEFINSHPSLGSVSMNHIITPEMITPVSKDDVFSFYDIDWNNIEE